MTRPRTFLLALVLGFVLTLGLADSANARPFLYRSYGGYSGFYNRNRMPGWDWWRIYPWSPYNAWRNPYWYPPYNRDYPYPPDAAYPVYPYPVPPPAPLLPDRPALPDLPIGAGYR